MTSEKKIQRILKLSEISKREEASNDIIRKQNSIIDEQQEIIEDFKNLEFSGDEYWIEYAHNVRAVNSGAGGFQNYR